MNEERTMDRAVVDAALVRAYGRLGSRILLVWFAIAVSLGAIAALVIATVGARYVGLSSSQALSYYALWGPIALVLFFVGLIRSTEQLRTILAWSGAGRTRARAVVTWYALISMPRVWTRGCAVVALGVLPAAVDFVTRAHLPWYDAFPIVIAPLGGLSGIWVLLVFTTELAMRPMLDDVASHLPAAFKPRTQGLRLRTKAVAPLPIVTLFAAIVVGGYANVSGDRIVRYLVVLGIAVAMVAIASVIFLIISRSVLAPIEDLIAATERVRTGDITTPVPLVTADELGTLAHSFNQMLADLRRHGVELRRSHARIVAAADEERRRVERDLHDGAQQRLVLLGLKLGLVSRAVENNPEAAALVEDARAELQRALAELRDLARGIYPALLENEGLPGALRDAVGRAAISARLDCDGAARYRPELEAAVYFCILEALQNAAKHAGEGAQATVRVSERASTLNFEVADNGRGFDTSGTPASSGVQNMADRLGALGGALEIISSPGNGTVIAGRVPLSD